MATHRVVEEAEDLSDTSFRHHQSDVVRRLERIEGQTSGIKRMYEGGRYCIDVLDQISAARAALQSAALLILEDHVNGCVTEAVHGGKGSEKATELLDAVRRFARSV